MSLKNPRDRVSSRDGFDSFSDYTQKSAGKAKKYRNSRRRVAGPLLVICAVVSVLVAANYWTNHGKIYQGVAVGDVALGGKTLEDAREILEERGANAFEKIRFTGGPEEEFVLTAEEMNLDFYVSGTVDQAYAVGREGGILERIGGRITAAWGTVRVAPVVNYEREAVRTKIENRAARVNEKPKDASVNIVGSEANVVESREGYAMDVEATAANVDEALDSMSGEAGIAG
ncbi:MAG: peptidoglycan binding domain-containing protein, partial [Rubrobacteraceae bacterium]